MTEREARISPSAGAELRRAIERAVTGIADALHVYEGSYVDLVLAAASARGPVALVAGTHTANFPYWGTEPWDNCLLLVGDTGYVYTGRTPGAALHIEFDLAAETATGAVRFDGDMRRIVDGREGPAARVELDLPIAIRRFPDRLLGEAYNFLEIDGLIGMRWNPWVLRGGQGSLRIDGVDLALDGIRGSAERGILTNLRARDFAIKYDYVAVARPGDGGYGLIHFTSHALHDHEDLLAEALDVYLRRSATATLTVADGALEGGNPRGVYVPPPDDETVFLFEAEVDLGAATLKRQMVETRDASGGALYGLREIFLAKPRDGVGAPDSDGPR